MKGQASLDFLMTYGWALLIIVLIVAALFSLGIFDAGTFLGSRSSGFTQIGVSAWRIDSGGNMTVQLRNRAGNDVNLTLINATLNNQSITYNTTTKLANGKASASILVGNFSNAPSSGGSYSVNMQITYTDLSTGFSYLDSGTVTGKVN